jgi:hypothetical protein
MKIRNLFYISIVLSFFACNTHPTDSLESKEFSVKVIVDYGEAKSLKEASIISNHPLTALEALQHVSVVETHPVKEHVFVSSIDSVRTNIGVKAWYYKVNGESPGLLAINNTLNNGDTLNWIYKTDVCSHTIDNK